MHGFQAAGAAPIVRGAPVEKPETIATAIRIGNPPRGRAPLRPGTSPAAASIR
jgi:threonine synthase